jgi:hypothetical protein
LQFLHCRSPNFLISPVTPSSHLSFGLPFCLRFFFVTIYQATKGPEGEWRYSATRFNLSARRSGWSAPHPGRFTPGKNPVPIVQEAGRATGPVWTCTKNLAPYRDSIPGPSSP